MRKLSFFVLISFIFIGFVSAQTITVTSPHAGDTWYKGHPYTIIWTKIGNTGINVKINIFKDIITPANCIGQLPVSNSGSQSWTIPSTYANGTYYIRIKGADSSWNDTGVYGDSGAFTITVRPRPIVKAIPKEPFLSIISPRYGETWRKYEREEIKWEHVNISGKIHLGLYRVSTRRSSRFVGFIAKSISVFPNSYKWKVGKFTDGRECASGDYYKVWIATQDGSLTNKGHRFRIEGINLVCEIKDAKCYDKKKRKKIFVLDTQGEYGSYLKFKIYAKNRGVWPATSLNVKWRWRAYRRTYNSDTRTVGPKTLIKTDTGRFILSLSFGLVVKSIGPVKVAADNGDLLILEVEIDPDNEFNESESYRRSNKVEIRWATT